jgi:hypothetical protein
MNKKRTKWITPIYRDPVGWSKKLAGSRLRMTLFVFVHILFVSGGLFTIYWFLNLLSKAPVKDATDIQTIGLWAILMGAGPIIFIGIFYPALYIYAIYRLLKIIEKKSYQGRSS